MSKMKAFAITAFLIILVILAIISSVFLTRVDACGRHRKPPKPRHPPLDKSIVITFTYPDGTPIGACLEVTLNDLDKSWTGHTDTEGTVVFPGLPDETYTWHWSWQGIPYQHSEEITCSKIVWEFTQTVDYWVVQKTFLYDATGYPVEGLEVHFAGQVGTTDADGLVVFTDVKAGDYTLEWVWGGLPKSEDISIGFQDPSPYVIDTNYLESKSWWRQ